MSAPTPSERRLSWAGAAVLIALIGALLAGYIIYRLESLPGIAAAGVRQAFGELAHFQPRITIGDRVIFEESKPAMELTVMERETHVERDITHSRLGSTKHLQLVGSYRVRAGFDLRKTCEVRITGRQVKVILPPPRILSIEQVSLEVGSFENGVWNKFSPHEVVEEVAALPILARQKASEAHIQTDALKLFTEQLRTKLGPQYDVEVVTDQPLAQPLVQPAL